MNTCAEKWLKKVTYTNIFADIILGLKKKKAKRMIGATVAVFQIKLFNLKISEPQETNPNTHICIKYALSQLKKWFTKRLT